MRADHVRPHYGQPDNKPHFGCPNAESDHLQPNDGQSDEEPDHVRAYVVRAYVVRADALRADNVRADDGRANHTGADNVRADNVRADNVWTNYPGPDNLRADYLRPNHVWTNHVRAHHVRPNHMRANYVRANHARANHAGPYHVLPDNLSADAARLLEPPRVGARQRASGHVRREHAAPGPVPLRMQARVLPVVRLSDDPVLHRAVDHRPVDVRARGESRRAGRLSVAARRVHKSSASNRCRARSRRVQRHAPHRGLSSWLGDCQPEFDTAHPRDGKVRRIQGGCKHRGRGGHDHADLLSRGARRGSADDSCEYANCDSSRRRLAGSVGSLCAHPFRLHIDGSRVQHGHGPCPYGRTLSVFRYSGRRDALSARLQPEVHVDFKHGDADHDPCRRALLAWVRDWDPRGPAQVRGRLVSLC